MRSTCAIGTFLLLALIWQSCSNNSSDSTSNISAAKGKVDFNFHVKPILSDKCFACHGPDAKKRQADFRLDNEEGAFKALKSDPNHFAIVKGNAEESILVKRIFSEE